MTPDATRPAHLQALLQQHLQALLGDIEPEALAQLLLQLQWRELPGGSTLMRQGEPGDALYLLVSGRLRALIADDGEAPRAVREITRGQIVGEMSLFTDEPRSATLVAVRDSVLVRLGKSEFKQLLTVSAQLSMALTRQIIHRLRTERTGPAPDRPVAIGLLPISAGVDLAGFAQRLAVQMAAQLASPLSLALSLSGPGGRLPRVAVVDAARLEAELGEPGLCQRSEDDLQASARIAVRLDQIEAEHEVVLLLADATPTPWTRHCSRHSDELLLLADARAPAAQHDTETHCLTGEQARTGAAQVLVLLHEPGTACPSGTATWLARRPLADHLHVRPALDADMARLARLQTRTAVGLVLAGGGARGLAHLGIWRALQEAGMAIDVVGGTSIGAVMAALVAADGTVDAITDTARRAFALKPTSDFNLLPMISLIRGRRLRRVVASACDELLGVNAQVDDLWKPCFIVATSYSQAGERVLRDGPLVQSLLASTAIPGALPPVVRDGELLCDGGAFNNFPVDVMRRMRGVGQVIGVDLDARKLHRITNEEVPGSWALLRDRLRPRSQRLYRLPSLPAYLMNVTILHSVSRQRQARHDTDLYFNPPLERVGMLQWHRFDQIVQQGYAYGREVLAARSAAAAADASAPLPATEAADAAD